MIAFVILTSFCISWLSTGMLIRLLRKRGLLDVPNQRSSHTVPTPRGGGLGILVGVGAALTVAAGLGLGALKVGLLAGAALVAICGLWDDFHGLSVRIRLLIQCVAAGMVIAGSGGLDRLPLPEPLAIPLGVAGSALAVLWIVGVTNIYNFLDGIDGFAGAQGLIAGAALALIDHRFSVAGSALAGASAGFLMHNWHPARIFMGDVGSTTLGFLFAALPWQIEPPGGRSRAVYFVALFLWFFLADGVFTLIRRVLRGEKIWLSHRSHLYQALALRLTKHDDAVRRIGSLAALLASISVLIHRANSAVLDWVALAIAVVLFAWYATWCDPLRRKESFCNVTKQV